MNEKQDLRRVIQYLEEKGWNPQVIEDDGVLSIEFTFRGVAYHIWEFDDGERGVDTNLRHGGGMEEITGDYADRLLEILEGWQP